MLKSIEEVDFAAGKPYRRKSDGLVVTAVEVKNAFEIVLPDEVEIVDHVRAEPEVVIEAGRKEIKVKETVAKAKVIKSHGGTIRGKAGDYIVRTEDGYVFVVSNRVRNTKEAPEALFEQTFDSI